MWSSSSAVLSTHRAAAGLGAPSWMGMGRGENQEEQTKPEKVKLLPAKQCIQNNHLFLAVLKWFNEVEGVIPQGHECWRHWVENNALCCMRSLRAGPPLAWPFCAMVGLPRPTWAGFELTQARHKPCRWGPVALEEPWPGSCWLRVQGLFLCPCPQPASAAPLAPQAAAVPWEGQQCLPSQSKNFCFCYRLWSCFVVRMLQDQTAQSRLQRCSASNIFGCDTTEILFL